MTAYDFEAAESLAAAEDAASHGDGPDDYVRVGGMWVAREGVPSPLRALCGSGHCWHATQELPCPPDPWADERTCA